MEVQGNSRLGLKTSVLVGIFVKKIFNVVPVKGHGRFFKIESQQNAPNFWGSGAERSTASDSSPEKVLNHANKRRKHTPIGNSQRPQSCAGKGGFAQLKVVGKGAITRHY